MLKKLNDAMDYIEAHLEDEFLLEKISEHINVSDYHFRKIFFALTNMTLNEYVKNRQLSEANKELLQGGAGNRCRLSIWVSIRRRLYTCI